MMADKKLKLKSKNWYFDFLISTFNFQGPF